MEYIFRNGRLMKKKNQSFIKGPVEVHCNGKFVGTAKEVKVRVEKPVQPDSTEKN